MKQYFFGLILFSLCVTTFPTRAQALKEVADNMKKQEEAWNRGDVDGFMAYYLNSDSLMFIGKKGLKKGWKTTRENYLKSYPDKVSMGILRFSLVKTEQVNSDCVFVIGHWELLKESPVEGYFTLLWKKTPAGWKIFYDHTS
ncbi:MAG TPA: DUF4440 domain-containing protein [Bacteroidia bacterium]|nr:DUF4440 domain-containing protein [Bacteroidia bacterium]